MEEPLGKARLERNAETAAIRTREGQRGPAKWAVTVWTKAGECSRGKEKANRLK